MPSSNTRHTQVQITHPSGESVWVDSGMSKLLEVCWQHGLETMYSCQEVERDCKAYIMFAEPAGAERFLNLACGKVDNQKGSLFSRVRQTSHFEEDMPRWAWEIWATLHDDNNQHYMEGPANKTPGLKVRTVIRFPCTDIPCVTRNLARPLRSERQSKRLWQVLSK